MGLSAFLSTQVIDFNEAVDDEVASLLVAGANISLTYNDAANTLTIAASAAGISSLGGQTGATQTFATGTSGTDFTIDSSGDVHTFAIPDAGASARGLVTTGTQTFAGAKTFANNLTLGANLVHSGGVQLQFTGASTLDVFQSSAVRVRISNGLISTAGPIRLGSSATATDISLERDSANTLGIRNGTNAQTVRVYNTFTSSTSGEFLQIRGVASNNFEIGPANGSGGGTLQGLTIGGFSAGSGTITPWLTLTNTGAATFASTVTLVPASSVTLGTNGQFSIEMTSNTAGNLVYRGSDGTTRRFAFTVS